MFISHPEHFTRNMRQAGTYDARPALLTAPDGSQEPAVVIYKARQIQGVIPIPEALRLANDIADAVDAHRVTEPKLTANQKDTPC